MEAAVESRVEIGVRYRTLPVSVPDPDPPCVLLENIFLKPCPTLHKKVEDQ